MNTSAIIMMVVSLVIIWGGLIVALKRLPPDVESQD
ncbi:methionine/alanine import family NSS transporter small subunit [Pasteurellaceae bacterium TAE3-ERU1]|nr:methionine/alanine import family NSS transporter small subunit [Spirabiliibacterium mucosae]MBE2898999.1 methionine/alanine import family NSS transporter small subunit [Spirabiliibacterium mucosae]MBV7388427.1 methionine/alanine import family NSS transporter small subunit [Pasteurellaceae bacterium TAE3-ERU1]